MKIIRGLLRYFRRINPFHKPQHRPPKSGLKLWKPIYYCKEDHSVLSAWAKERDITKVAMAHILVTSFMQCNELKHEEEIKTLTEERDILSSILADYIKRFGKIIPFDGNKSKTLVNQ